MCWFPQDVVSNLHPAPAGSAAGCKHRIVCLGFQACAVPCSSQITFSPPFFSVEIAWFWADKRRALGRGRVGIN